VRYKTITFTVSHGIATIALDRGDRLNALNSEMRQELTEALILAPRNARALVLTGRGPGFCAGQDLGDVRRLGELDVENLLNEEYTPLIKALAECPIPTLCAVNGAAAGGGASLALAADITIAARSAYFDVAFARIGLMPDVGATWWLPRRIGLARAMAMSLLAEPVPAARAAEWGLIWEVTEDDALYDRAAEIADRLASGPTAAFDRIKQALRAGLANDLDDQLALEARLQGELGRSHDFREGVMAFLEKRPAAFRGD